MKKASYYTACVLSITAAPSLALAETDPSWFTPEKVTVGLSLGQLQGEAKERVYDPEEGGRKVSQLNWKYNNAAIIKGDFAWDFSPWASLGFNGWTTLASSGASMDDYDWLDTSKSQWTDWSSHSNTKLNYANEFDINIKGWLLNEEQYRLGLLAGYQQSAFSWLAKGGSYNYNSGNDIGNWPRGELSIGYKQKFKLPYIGLVGRYQYEKFETNLVFKYSNWVSANANDEHYARNTTFKDDVNNARYYAVVADVGYYVTPQAKVYLEGSWNQYQEKRGSVSSHDRSDGSYTKFKDSGSMENEFYTVTLGVKYSF